MKFYSAKIRLAGSLLNEVLRTDLSAPEVLLLNEIHGEGSIASLTETGEKEFGRTENRVERRRLERKYGADPANIVSPRNAELLQRLFPTVDLPQSVSPADLIAVSDADIEDLADQAEVPSAPVPATKPVVDDFDAKGQLKETIRKLGGVVPPGNVSEERLRAIVTDLQLAQSGLEMTE